MTKPPSTTPGTLACRAAKASSCFIRSRSMGVFTSPVTSDNHTPCLIPLNADKHPGTYAYQGKWEVIDHILVSHTLLNSNSHLHTSKELARIATLPFLLTKDEKYGIDIPFRTYIGPRYLGGFSDHLPIVADFIKKEL